MNCVCGARFLGFWNSYCFFKKVQMNMEHKVSSKEIMFARRV